MITHKGRDESGAPTFTDASVFIDGRETGYRRAGRGSPIVVLAGDDHTREVLARTLAGVGRVIVPERSAGDDSNPACSWIRGLLDGLGLESAGVVCDEVHALPAITLAFADPDRIRRLAILLEPGRSPLVSAAGIEDRLASTDQRILLTSRNHALGTCADGAGSSADAQNRPAWVAAVVSHFTRP